MVFLEHVISKVFRAIVYESKFLIVIHEFCLHRLLLQLCSSNVGRFSENVLKVLLVVVWDFFLNLRGSEDVCTVPPVVFWNFLFNGMRLSKNVLAVPHVAIGDFFFDSRGSEDVITVPPVVMWDLF